MRLAALWRASDGRTATTGASAPATDVTSAAAAAAAAVVEVEAEVEVGVEVVVEVTVDVAGLAPPTSTSSDAISEASSVADGSDASAGDAATKAIGATERR